MPCAADGGRGEPAHAAGADDGGARLVEVAEDARRPPRGAICTSETLCWSMSVSAWARLPTRRACWKSALSDSPTWPGPWAAARASRIWPRIWASPTAIESRPQATVKAWATARVVVAHVEVVGERLGRGGADGSLGGARRRAASACDAGGERERLADGGDGGVEGRHLRVDLEAVARREHDGLGGRGRRRAPRPRWPRRGRVARRAPRAPAAARCGGTGR